jgi:Raf kinase inhibitor-like YbhB/YbcL family protein
MGFRLSSPEFENGEFIPIEHTCEGDIDMSPELTWSDPPAGTRSFALIVEDLDALDPSFTNWVLFDIPAEVTSLPHGVKGVGKSGKNGFNVLDYRGPCPPPEQKTHRYVFQLFALNVTTLGLPEGAHVDDVQAVLRSRILGSARLLGIYQREMPTAANDPRVHREHVP